MKLILKNSEIILKNYKFEWEILDYSSLSYRNRTIYRDEWQSVGHSYMVPINETTRKVEVKVAADASGSANIAFLTSDSSVGFNVTTYCEGTGLVSIPVGETKVYDVPSDCTNIYILTTFNSEYDNQRRPEQVRFYQ